MCFGHDLEPNYMLVQSSKFNLLIVEENVKKWCALSIQGGEKKPVQENLPLHLVAAHEPKLASPVGHLPLDYLGELE